jgi:hypothetical protein
MTKIELGKTYRTRDGREVKIYAVDGGGEFPIHGGVHRRLTVTDGTKRAFVTVSGSPRGMCYLNIAKDARRALREAP